MANEIPGGEAFLAPDPPEDEAKACDHDGATLLAMVEGGEEFAGMYACSRCGEPFRPTNDLAEDDEEDDELEIEAETELSGPYEDLRILEIPLAAHYPATGVAKLFVAPEPRYAILGVPILGFSEDDRQAIQRVLYALRVSKTPTAEKEPSDG